MLSIVAPIYTLFEVFDHLPNLTDILKVLLVFYVKNKFEFKCQFLSVYCGGIVQSLPKEVLIKPIFIWIILFIFRMNFNVLNGY